MTACRTRYCFTISVRLYVRLSNTSIVCPNACRYRHTLWRPGRSISLVFWAFDQNRSLNRKRYEKTAPTAPWTNNSKSSVTAVAQIYRKIWRSWVSQVKPSNCCRLHPTTMLNNNKYSTIPVPDSLYAPRKISFTFNFRHKAFCGLEYA